MRVSSVGSPLLVAAVFGAAWILAAPQQTPPVVGVANAFAVTQRVTELQRFARMADSGERRERPEPGELPESLIRRVPGATREAMRQARAPIANMPSAIVGFDGLSNDDNTAAFGYQVYPPDTNGDVGPSHYVQAVNQLVRVFNKSGGVLATFKMSTLFASLGGLCATRDNGDPVVLYDQFANRWFISQFGFTSLSEPPYHQCIAVSATADPLGAYYAYDFVMPNTEFNDYPHFGVWPDGYYMSDNQFLNGGAFDGAGAFAFDRAKMLVGDPAASYIYFNLGSTFGGMLPSDVDGATLPPAGTPNYFGMLATTTSLRLFGFHADFSVPANSTFTELPGSPVTVASFDPNLPESRASVSQPAPATLSAYLDSLQDRLMHRLTYRNFGGTRESLVVTHTVNVGPDATTIAGYQAAIRYYEFRRALPSGVFSVAEQATFAPDGDHRFFGSAAMDGQGNIAVGYSVSSTSTFPSVRYAGRLATDPPNGLYQGEASLIAGSGVQLGTSGRWGDYSALSIDPTDDCTFWYTTEYYSAASQASSTIGWLTRIGSFKFPSCGGEAVGTLTGHVRNDSGTAVANASVTLSPGGQVTFTDANGLYTLSVPPGTYTVTAAAPFHAAQSVSAVSIVNGGSVTQDFVVTFIGATLSGHVRDAAGAAVASASIAINPGDVWVATDAAGAFRQVVAAGTYTLSASAFNLQPSATLTRTMSQAGSATADFVLDALPNRWQPVTAAPFSPSTCLLLTDASVLCQNAAELRRWWKLVPDVWGSYASGTWTQVASTLSTYGPTYYASAVLPDGRVVVEGGSFNVSDGVESFNSNQGAIYDPVANAWTALSPPSGWSFIGQAASAVLPTGRLMVLNPLSREMALFNASDLSWQVLAPSGRIGYTGYDGVTLLPDGSLFSVATRFTIPSAHRYLSSTNTWISAGDAPVSLVDNSYVGPQMAMPDGTVLVIGSTGQSAIYMPPAAIDGLGSWAVGPAFPVAGAGGSRLRLVKGPAALLPTGRVLIGVSTGIATPPSHFFEVDATVATPVASPSTMRIRGPYYGRMLTLPSGQVMLANATSSVQLYTPAGAIAAGATPAISSAPLFVRAGGTYTVTGTRFNGVSQATLYNTGAQAATNYPLVRLTNVGTGHVRYARTHGHSTMAIRTGDAIVSTNFDVPAGIEGGATLLQVVVNGVASSGATIAVKLASPTFTDDPLQPGVTAVRAVHLRELQGHIDTLRAEYGLAGFAWSDAPTTTGVTPIRAAHVNELRTALASVYMAAGRPAPDYTRSTVAGGVSSVAAVDISELRAAIGRIW